LKQTPYLTTPTRLVGTLPLEKVFCGRQNEIAQLKKIIYSSSNSATLITGDFGVGKTTFVNFVKWNLAFKKF
jgi:Cdc6-like AAA superfamily ATPase